MDINESSGILSGITEGGYTIIVQEVSVSYITGTCQCSLFGY